MAQLAALISPRITVPAPATVFRLVQTAVSFDDEGLRVFLGEGRTCFAKRRVAIALLTLASIASCTTPAPNLETEGDRAVVVRLRPGFAGNTDTEIVSVPNPSPYSSTEVIGILRKGIEACSNTSK